MENNRKEGEIRIDTERQTYKTIAQGLKVQQQATSEVLINNNDGRKDGDGDDSADDGIQEPPRPNAAVAVFAVIILVIGGSDC